MGLNQYHKKRDFTKTPEPKGKVTKDHSRLFVIQKHAASHLHYDFRLELHGVLKSWAIPKGPSLDPKTKRLAMHVEDHPIEYGSFEGIIPKGQYGGGTVMLWDEGTWEPLDDDPYKAYEKGHLRFNLHAQKLKGRWDLIRFKDEKHWFLIKYQDEYAKEENDYDITRALTKSVKSNHSIEEIAEHYTHVWQNSEAKAVKSKKTKHRAITKPTIVLPEGISKTNFPEFIAPQLATLVDKTPEGNQWAHEIKLDGYRILAFKNGSEVTLKSRNNKDWTQDLQPIADAVALLPFKQIVLDGEVVILDAEGRSDFQLLQNSIKNKEQAPFIYFLFDLLYFEGYDLRKLTLIERKSILKNILTANIPRLHYSDHIIKEGKELYEYSCKHALEGIISKRVKGTYLSKRSKDWLKIKCLKRQEFVIGGYTPPKGGRAHFGSLFLGIYNKEGKLDYAGNVGTGFSSKSLNEINQLLLQNKGQTNPFTSKPPGFSQAHWLEPVLVCEVEFTEWTEDGHLRHPSFKGMRLDKKAIEIVRESELPVKQVEKEKSTHKTTKKSTFTVTNPDKILYPEDGIRKKDLLTYYEEVSDYILPYLTLRPLTLVRCPSHYNECFYQRHYNKATEKALHPIDDPKDEEHERYIYLNDQQGLLSLVQMGVLEIHPWGSTIKHLEEPDIIILDLDPAPDVPWADVVKAALDVRDHLNQYKLKSFVKSTGGKGLHVVIPILPEYEWEEVKQFTHIFVQFLEKLNPKNYISKMTKSKRGGKIFIDYLRNQRTATAIGPYSTRARLHAPVATPLSWDELSNHKEENSFTIKTLPKRLKKLKEDPWQSFWTLKQSLRLDEL
ncbi:MULTISPECIES: DNA ligase D [Legionella]|uniref:DNA ligase (ATP) n=1 Tax=Legionella resiliens TaxID=2905958 RepID=A0ABS8X0S6_9GAMM|nr:MULTISPECIES: DNA ligase D [unclassified Legionella]MCE0723198.1 DNA ligase D [Legionella sp. 9fVS26]MCE3532351.1 DNA ligase D [Legionella sp. 8cVS16]QLZ68491.1 Multifunctional non-homologous end joining protein LigD [Legionella sp. PC1000]